MASAAGTTASGAEAMFTSESAVNAPAGMCNVIRPSALETLPPADEPTICPDAVTVRIAALLVTEPAELLTATENFAPESDVAVEFMVYVLSVAPAITVPPRCHWNVRGVVPEAVTAKVTG